MKYLIFLLILISGPSFTLAASHGWEQLSGCYVTRAVNGYDIKEEFYWNDGSSGFDYNDATLVKNLDGSPIRSFSHLMYVTGSNLGTDVVPVEIFLGKGKHKKENGYIVYSFNGPLAYAFQPGIVFNYDIKSMAKWIDEKTLNIKGHVKYSHADSGTHNEYIFNSLLEKVTCKEGSH